MKYRLTYSIHHLNKEKAKELAKSKRGIFATMQPEKDDDNEVFEDQIVFFDTREYLNSFIYNSYISFGAYFFVNEIVRAAYVF